MSSFAERQRAAIEGTSTATKQVARLGLDAERPVDVFGVIESEQIWLMFEQLERLFGFFQRAEPSAGIAINSAHPLSLQRFTAAHEYGHFVLGHSFSQDSREEIYGGGVQLLQEIQAQAFASEFLMPLALVNRAMDRLSLPREPEMMAPVQAYQLSLEVGASYRATVARLNELNKISRPLAEELRGEELKEVKVEIGGGKAPASSRAAVWSVDEGLRERHLGLRIEDELHVRLPEIPSSGYRWDSASEGALELISDQLEADPTTRKRLGGVFTRHLWWRAVTPGAGTLELRLAREWEGAEGEAADAITLPLSVELPRAGLESGTGLSLPQREAILARSA